MNTPELPAELSARIPPSAWPDAVVAEWCRLHRLIDDLSSVQRRLGTPLEEPDDFRVVRSLGSNIAEVIEDLRPWMEKADVENAETVG
jgi:hypothetical protein